MPSREKMNVLIVPSKATAVALVASMTVPEGSIKREDERADGAPLPQERRGLGVWGTTNATENCTVEGAAAGSKNGDGKVAD